MILSSSTWNFVMDAPCILIARIGLIPGGFAGMLGSKRPAISGVILDGLAPQVEGTAALRITTLPRRRLHIRVWYKLSVVLQSAQPKSRNGPMTALPDLLIDCEAAPVIVLRIVTILPSSSAVWLSSRVPETSP